jgi:hypothetical protein
MTKENKLTSNQKARPILQALDIGDDVAEFDERLSNYFIETSSFKDITADKADLILGAKGSGKSAIFRHLANPRAGIPELEDVDIIPAFNVQGSVIFRRLSTSPPVSEPAYRFIWFTFIVALMANHLLSSYDDVLNLDRLAKLIDAADLRVVPLAPTRLWEKIENLIKAISRRLEIEGELEFGIPKLPVKAKTKGTFRASEAADEAPEEQVDLEEILYICADQLARINRRCWVVFDRLDEAFEHSQELESTVLRGLMRAHLDMASYGASMRTKLFLRSDIMDRIMREKGFVNATHLRRLHLQWDQEGIIDLLSRRIISTQVIAEVYGISPEGLKRQSGRLDICRRVLPGGLDNNSLIEWISIFTADASRALNPRNVLTLIRLARQHQLAVYDRDDPDLASVPTLISTNTMKNALASLSQLRLEDTVYAEFNSLRGVIQALHGKSFRLTREQLATYIRTDRQSEHLNEVLEGLEYAGIVSISRRGIITIAKLYRPALGMDREHISYVSIEEEEHLKVKVYQAVTSWPQDRDWIELPGLNKAERTFVHDYVRTYYPACGTDSESKGEPSGIKTLIIRRLDHNASMRRLTSEVIKRGRHVRKLERRHERASPPQELESYDHDSHNIELLVGLREEAATSTEGYFVTSPIERILTTELIEIDRHMRKNKSRRRIIALLGNPETAEARLILGRCHARVIDTSGEVGYLPEGFRSDIEGVVASLCNIAANETDPIIVSFSCSRVRTAAMSFAARYPSLTFTPLHGTTAELRKVITIQSNDGAIV